MLREYLSEDEVREICFEMDIDWEGMQGDSKRSKILSLVLSLERQGILYQFEDMVRKHRPNVDWPPFV